jgi:hypothetical protein
MASTTTHIRPQDDLPKTHLPETGNKGSSSVADKAKDIASNVADKAKEAACGVGARAEDATHAVGSGMQSLAGTVRDKLPQSGMLGSAGSTLASGLENTGRYLQEGGLKGMGEDLTSMIRRNPLPAMLIGIGLGFMLARFTSRS